MTLVRKLWLPIFSCLFAFLLLAAFVPFSRAEDKPSGGIIPKLPKTPNDPELFNGHVYPEWGPICQRYTYSTIYRDKEGQPPEYVQIYFNGQMIDMEKADPVDNDYQKGVRYEYKYVPKKLGSNFYFFEASNGLGKTRDSIIDSPDNGPVLFESAFDQNEIALIDSQTATKVWSYPTGKEWVGGLALSADGQYLAALTSYHVYFFSTTSAKPLWEYEFRQSSSIGGGPRGNGLAISRDGSRVIAATGMEVVLFSQESNRPVWKHQSPALAVAISQDGQYAAASSAKQGQGEMVNVLFLWQTDSSRPLWEFTNNSNFHDVSLSADGQYLAASTGCPDRKGYIFSKENNRPLVQSERLTFDSPVSKSRISADGSLAAFATEGGPDSNVVAFFSKDSSIPLWEFDNQKRNSTRAMSMTADGQYIAAATMIGEAYLLAKDSSVPIKSWSLNTSVGGLDIADDGSFVALGGTDKQVSLLFINTQEKKTIPINEFIQAIDIAANGKYVAAGTGGSVYFFGDYLTSNKGKTFECSTIIEPESQKMTMAGYEQERLPESPLNYKPQEKSSLPLVFGQVAVLVTILAFSYWLLVRFPKIISLTHPAVAVITLPMAMMLWSINSFQFNFRTITDFCATAFSFWTILLLVSLVVKIPKGFFLIGALFFAIFGSYTLITYSPFFSGPTLVHLAEAIFGFGYLSGFLKGKARLIFLAGVILFLIIAFIFYQFWGFGFLPNLKGGAPDSRLDSLPGLHPDKLKDVGSPDGEAACGNGLCEPDSGETRENCFQDCSAGD